MVDGWWLPILLAPFVGSFAGVLIRRLPEDRTVLWDRSACEACRHTLSPLEMVPLASFLAQRGRCRHCGAAIPPAHLWIELAALAVAVSAVCVDAGGALWAGCALGWTLLALAWIDAEHFWLPDALTLPLVVAGLGATWLLAPWALTDHAAAAALGYGAFRIVAWVYERVRGRAGLGEGDAKLLAASGAWLGLSALAWVILGAAVAGLLAALAWRLAGRRVDRSTALPFGPALAAATWALWLLGPN